MGLSFKLDFFRRDHNEVADIVPYDENPETQTPDDPKKGTGAEPEKMVLRTENLVKIYGKRTVADHVSIDVTQGEIVGLLGPNGAGKTTTFYMTTGLIRPNAGKIFIDNLEITDYPVYKRARKGIGYLAQEASVFRKLSVEDNIRAVLQMTGKPKDYQRDKLETLIKEFNLQKVRKNKSKHLKETRRHKKTYSNNCILTHLV